MRPLLRSATFSVLLVAVLSYVAAAYVLPDRDSDPTGYWTLRGSTDQSEAIKLRLDARGRVRTFDVRVDLNCKGGLISNTGWHPSEGGAPARFGSRGPNFDAVELRRGRDVTVRGDLRGRVSKRRASGTVRMTRDSGRAGGPECDSGVVHWATD